MGEFILALSIYHELIGTKELEQETVVIIL